MARLNSEMHPLLTQEVLELLFSKNIYTVPDYINADLKQLVNIMRFAIKDVITVKNHIINKNAGIARNGRDLYEQLLKRTAIIPTGIENLDTFLKGGLVTGKIYEICGPPASGKTQLCLTLCKNVSEKLSQNIYYLDTKRDFSAKRLKTMLATKTEKEIADLFSLMLIKCITTKHDLINSLYTIKEEIRSGLKCRLVIIDSLPPLFTNTDDYNVENNIFLSQMASIIHYLASEYHMVFVITNLLRTWTEGGFQEIQMVESVACGKYWSNVPHNRMKIEKVDEDKCRISFLKSCEFPLDKLCDVLITNEGVI